MKLSIIEIEAGFTSRRFKRILTTLGPETVKHSQSDCLQAKTQISEFHIFSDRPKMALDRSVMVQGAFLTQNSIPGTQKHYKVSTVLQ